MKEKERENGEEKYGSLEHFGQGGDRLPFDSLPLREKKNIPNITYHKEKETRYGRSHLTTIIKEDYPRQPHIQL